MCQSYSLQFLNVKGSSIALQMLGLHRQFVIGERYIFIVESGGKLFSQSGKLVYFVTDKIVATIAPRYTEVLYCAHEIQESAREPAQSHVGAD